MADFPTAINKVLDHEGGYQNHEADFGNYNAYDIDGNLVPYKERRGRTLRAGTNMGISAGFLSGKLGRAVSVSEMQGLTREKVSLVYRRYFWDDILGDKINHQRVAETAMDARVLHGHTGKKLLQRTLNALGNSLEVDGKVGPITLDAINRADPARLINGLSSARAGLVKRLAREREGNGRYLDGWLKRINSFRVATAEAARRVPPAIPIGVGLGLAALIYFNSDE